MRKSQTQKINDVIKDFFKEINIDRKLKEVNLVSKWEELMGNTVSRRTSHIYIRNRVLFITVTSSVLKNELLMMRQDIVKRLNENAGETLIDEIVIR